MSSDLFLTKNKLKKIKYYSFMLSLLYPRDVQHRLNSLVKGKGEGDKKPKRPNRYWCQW
jgi:hypothetical protein